MIKDTEEKLLHFSNLIQNKVMDFIDHDIREYPLNAENIKLITVALVLVGINFGRDALSELGISLEDYKKFIDFYVKASFADVSPTLSNIVFEKIDTSKKPLPTEVKKDKAVNPVINVRVSQKKTIN